MDTGGLRPRRVGEILDAAIKLYIGNARVLLGAAAIAVVPLRLLSALILLSAYSSGQDITTGFSSTGTTVTPAVAHARLGASIVSAVISILVGAFVTAASVKAISNAYMDHPVNLGESLRFALRRLLPLIALQFLYFIGLIIAFVALIIPGIWLYGAWAVAIPALLIEGTGPFRSLSRSRRLVKGRWWATAGVLLVSNIMVFVVGAALGAALTAIALTNSNPSILFAVSISTLSAIVTGVLVQPFVAAVTTVLYYDLRVRREGYDLEVMADQLGLPPPVHTDGPGGFTGPPGPEHVGQPGGPPFWPPPPGWRPGQ